MSDEINCDNNSFYDAYSPKEMACKAETIGSTKAELDFLSTFLLSVLAGAFIAMGAAFFTTVVTGAEAGLGPSRLVASTTFCLGLIMVVVAGAELFTGNTLIVIATISGKVSVLKLFRNWGIVYFGNLAGSLMTVILVYYADQYWMGGGTVGVTAYNVAGAKLSLDWTTAFVSGIMCNALVCMAIWMCYSARRTTDKILAILFPIAAFVTLGFEHSVANMYFVPYGIMLAANSDFTSAVSVAPGLGYAQQLFTASNFVVRNLIPVTLGNIVGGSLLVGTVYWLIYLRDGRKRVKPINEFATIETEDPDELSTKV